jgi:hypothetical protein
MSFCARELRLVYWMREQRSVSLIPIGVAEDRQQVNSVPRANSENRPFHNRSVRERTDHPQVQLSHATPLMAAMLHVELPMRLSHAQDLRPPSIL